MDPLMHLSMLQRYADGEPIMTLAQRYNITQQEAARLCNHPWPGMTEEQEADWEAAKTPSGVVGLD